MIDRHILSCLVFPFLFLSCYNRNAEVSNTLIDESRITRITSDNPEIPYNVEIYTPQKLSEGKVLYYFHGIGGGYKSWRGDYSNLHFAGHEEPIVISISFGKVWMFKNGGRWERGYLPMSIYAEEILPIVESELNIDVKSRIGWGFSMGGYNLLMTAFYYPGLFDKIILNSPSIHNISPYDEKEDIESYIRQQETKYSNLKSRLKMVLGFKSKLRYELNRMLNFQRMVFPSKTDWEQNDIFYLLEQGGVISPDTYISCGTKDEHGLFDGAEQLYKILIRNENSSVHFKPISNGDHISKDHQSISSFIQETH